MSSVALATRSCNSAPTCHVGPTSLLTPHSALVVATKHALHTVSSPRWQIAKECLSPLAAAWWLAHTSPLRLTYQCFGCINKAIASVAVWARSRLVLALRVAHEHVLCSRPQLRVDGIRLQQGTHTGDHRRCVVSPYDTCLTDTASVKGISESGQSLMPGNDRPKQIAEHKLTQLPSASNHNAAMMATAASPLGCCNPRPAMLPTGQRCPASQMLATCVHHCSQACRGLQRTAMLNCINESLVQQSSIVAGTGSRQRRPPRHCLYNAVVRV